jgi:glycerophosphoryl diester phosphodiesterase
MKPKDLSSYHVLALPYKYRGIKVITPHFIDYAHAQNKYLVAWTVNDREKMQRLLEWGIDGIMTDRPDLLREVLGS